jgi:hydrogenase expression/formation protein HypE
MGAAAQRADVKIVTGDTKVVPRGVTDKILINTSGIGLIPEDIDVGSNKAQPGDKIILNGTIADHGVAILVQREGLSLESGVKSDTAPLNKLVEQMFQASKSVHVLRDPTRGGVGTALNEIAEKSSVGIRILEERIPVRDDVAGVCELLGLDPLYLANEGKLLAFVAADDADRVLAAMQQQPLGQEACIIGETLAEYPGRVVMETRMGGNRIVDMLTGEQFPRIC